MTALPSKRLLVYVALGVVVLVVGSLAVVSMRGSDKASGEELVVKGGTLSSDGELGPLSLEASSTTSTTVPKLYVQVVGAVRRPGVYEMAQGARVFQAVEQAGGFTGEADEEAVPLAAPVVDGCRVYVPALGEAGGEAPPDAGAPTIVAPSGVGAGGAGGLVSLNTASASELESLPGIGPSTAQKIIQYREDNGPFTSVEQLLEVSGIGPAKFEQIKSLVQP